MRFSRIAWLKRRVAVPLSSRETKAFHCASCLSNENPFGVDPSPREDGVREALRKRKQEFLNKINDVNKKYEEFIGLSDVLTAQERVKRAEKDFLDARTKERALLREMVDTREKLKNIRERLSHVDYSDTMYLQLASDQHELVNEEDRQKRKLEEVEDNERDSFLELSTAMRESYEHERARVERTKNWSIIGTVIGTMIGMIGAIYMNRVRTKELLKAVKEHGNSAILEDKVENLATELEKQHSSTCTALSSVAENLSEMNAVIQVQNLQVMAGFVDDALNKDENDPQSKENIPKKQNTVASTSLKALTDEMTTYNEALNSLVHAVTSLSNANLTSANVDDSTSGIESLLSEQVTILASLQAKIEDISTVVGNSEMSPVRAKLDDINRRLSALQLSRTDAAIQSEGAVIYELPSEDSHPLLKPDWTSGIKDAIFWASILGCLYSIIKF